jgi:hypothetical protein
MEVVKELASVSAHGRLSCCGFPDIIFMGRYIIKEGCPTGRNTMPEKNVNASINKGEQPS